MGGGGGPQCTPPHPLFFLPFTQNIFRQPIPENPWPFKLFVADAPIEKILNLDLSPLRTLCSDTINFVTYSLFPSKGEFHVINDFVKRFSDIKRLISNMRELNSGALFFLRDLHPCCSLKQPYFVNFANDWMTKTGGFSYYYFADFRVKKSLYALALQ